MKVLEKFIKMYVSKEKLLLILQAFGEKKCGSKCLSLQSHTGISFYCLHLYRSQHLDLRQWISFSSHAWTPNSQQDQHLPFQASSPWSTALFWNQWQSTSRQKKYHQKSFTGHCSYYLELNNKPPETHKLRKKTLFCSQICNVDQAQWKQVGPALFSVNLTLSSGAWGWEVACNWAGNWISWNLPNSFYFSGGLPSCFFQPGNYGACTYCKVP